MTRYRYDGDVPAVVPILHRGAPGSGGKPVDPVMPGEIIESDVVLHNPVFTIVDDRGKPTRPALVSPELIGEFDGTGSHLAASLASSGEVTEGAAVATLGDAAEGAKASTETSGENV